MRPTDLPPMDPELEALFAAERARCGLPEGLAPRAYARIAATLGLPGGPSGSDGPEGGPSGSDGSPSSPAAPSAGAGAGALAGNAAGGALVGKAAATAGIVSALIKPATLVALVVGASLGSAGTYLAVRPAPERGEAPRTASRAAKVPQRHAAAHAPAREEPRRPQVAAPASIPRAHSRSATPPARAAVAASQPSRLAEERQLITMARVALGRGDHESARKALREHGRAHPAGQLAEEREALVVLTLIRLGQVSRAREVAVRFRRSYPRSLLLPTIEAALAQARP